MVGLKRKEKEILTMIFFLLIFWVLPTLGMGPLIRVVYLFCFSCFCLFLVLIRIPEFLHLSISFWLQFYLLIFYC
ncbi:hypothetical protein PRUPE_1G240600 [Prunus persica]|uniref:Uncharacterized protein n=1 Tax=Prunus persica TaxID=3760 RepID=A0A251R2M6_PRUPE|nr:hypothetical protein PRUPE_1G240600 [Prunus persica]